MAKISIIMVVLTVVGLIGASPRPQDNSCDLFCLMKKQINNGLPGNTIVKKHFQKHEKGGSSYTSDNFGSNEVDGSSFTLEEHWDRHENRESSVIINNSGK